MRMAAAAGVHTVRSEGAGVIGAARKPYAAALIVTTSMMLLVMKI